MEAMEKQAQAEAVLFGKVYLPAFVKAAAARGIVFSNDDEIADALRIADRLRGVQAAQEVQGGGILKQAALDLDRHLGLVQESQPAVDVSGLKADADVSAALAALNG